MNSSHQLRPLRILIDVRRLRGFGIGTYIRNLIHGLAALDQPNHNIREDYEHHHPKLQDLPANFETAVWHRRQEHWRNNFLLPLFFKRWGADLFHIPLNSVPLWMPKPYVVTIHDMGSLLFNEPGGLRNHLRRVRFRRGLSRADRVIAVSAATKRDVENLLSIPARRIRLIYNAPDPIFNAYSVSQSASSPELCLLRPERSDILARYQIQYPFLLYAGRIRPQKNIPRLVEAFAVVRGELEHHPVYKDLRLIIIGDEISKSPSVRLAVIRSHVEHVVRFLGFVPIDTLRVFYEAASAFVFPSLYEGFGLPPLEAMACGTPVVTTSVSSLPEVVGEAAMIVNPENVFDIARGIREVLLDESLRRAYIKKGFEQLRHFSWQQTARQVLDTYREVGGSR